MNFISVLLLLAAILATNLGVVVVGAAEDPEEECETWAASGECNLNPNYMLANCVVACEKQTALDMTLAQEIGKTIVTFTHTIEK